MAKADNEDIDSQNDEEDEEDDDSTDDQKKVDKSDTSDSQTDNDDDDSADEDDDDQDLKKSNKKLFERTKKAEGFVKDKDGNWIRKFKPKMVPVDEVEDKKKPGAKKPEAAQADGGLTPMDAIILGKADITEQEDIEEVINFAGYRKLTIPQALKDKTLQTILSERKEQRATAEATHTGGGRRGSRAPSTDEVLDNAEQGKFPEKPEDLAAARAEKRKNRNKK